MIDPISQSHQPVLEHWHSDACRNFYAGHVDGVVSRGATFDAVRGVFVPASAGGMARLRRLVTWEDTLNSSALRPLPRRELDALSERQRPTFPPPLALRTLRRPGRAWSRSCQGHITGSTNATCVPFYAPLIEKSGSSTLSTLLRRRGGVGGYCRCGPASLTQLQAARRLMAEMPPADCCLAGSHRATRGRAYRFAFVRHPLHRFLSGALPLTVGLCNGEPCEADMRRLRAHARSLAREFRVRLSAPPHSIHYRTQAYFLSTTDASGEPTRWDFVGRLETFDADWRVVSRVLDRHKNASGAAAARAADAVVHGGATTDAGVRLNAGHDAPTRAAFLRAVQQREPELLCDVCAVYAQDFVCLGYTLPPPCQPGGRCSRSKRVGSPMPPRQAGVAAGQRPASWLSSLSLAWLLPPSLSGLVGGLRQR